MKSLLNIALACCLVAAPRLVLAADDEADTVNVPDDPTGVYTLVSVNGDPLPATLNHEGATLLIRSGSFTINADGTCVSRMVFVPPPGTEVTREVRATYTRDGARLTMQWEGAGTTVGTVEGNTFTMNNEGMVLVYRK